MSNASRSVDETTMTNESPVESKRSDGERELAGYLDEFVPATCAEKTPGRSVEGREPNEPASTDLGSEEPEGAALEPTPEAGTPPQKPPAASRQTRGTTRASMSEGLLALFRDTGRLSSPPSTPAPSVPSPGSEPGPPAPEPSMFLRRFLQQAACSPELAASGLASLDDRLAGGFGSGLHLVQGGPGVGKTAFLESVAWEAVSSGRPVLYYALKEGSIGAWERLISTLGNILGTAIPLGALRARTLGPDQLETLARLDLALQDSVLPLLSLIETIPACTDTLGAFIKDIRSRAQEAKERHGRIPLLLIDDLERLLLLARARPRLDLLSPLNDALSAESIPGLLATAPDSPERLPAQTTLNVVPVSASATDALVRVDLELRTNASTGWTGTLPLLLDRRSGLFTLPAQHPARAGRLFGRLRWESSALHLRIHGSAIAVIAP
jgi:hypothetical protein